MVLRKPTGQSFVGCLRPHHLPPWAAIYGLTGPPADGAEGSVRPTPGHDFPKEGLYPVPVIALPAIATLVVPPFASWPCILGRADLVSWPAGLLREGIHPGQPLVSIRSGSFLLRGHKTSVG